MATSESPNLSRRSLLKVGVVGAGVLAIGGVGLGLRGTVLRAPAQPLQVLSPEGFSILAAVADRTCPGGEGLPGAAEIQVAEKIDALLHRMHPADGPELEQGLMFIENALVALLFEGRTTPFTQLAGPDQDRVLRAFRVSAWPVRRKVFRVVTGLCASAYWGDRRTWAHIGYGGPPDYSSIDMLGVP